MILKSNPQLLRVSCGVVSIKLYSDWTLIFWNHVESNNQISTEYIKNEYSSIFKPYWLPGATIITKPSHDTIHDVPSNESVGFTIKLHTYND